MRTVKTILPRYGKNRNNHTKVFIDWSKEPPKESIVMKGFSIIHDGPLNQVLYGGQGSEWIRPTK
jgi:hypothetical protein